MLNTLIVVKSMTLLLLTISWVSMSMCMTTLEDIETINMANQVDFTDENRENRLCFLTCRGTLYVPDLAHLLAQLGSVLDPKCDS